MYILGVSAYYHDSSAALIKDGRILCAVQEERFTRIKHDNSFPIKSIEYCLSNACIKINQIDAIVFYEKPLLKFERIISNFLHTWPFSLKQFLHAIPSFLSKKVNIRANISKTLKINKNKIFFSSHHISHAAHAVYTSEFKSCAVLVIDGVGELSTTSIGKYKNNQLKIIKEIHFPHSIGLLYSAITGFLGFKVNSGEYKVMGLSPYGEDNYRNEFDKLISLNQDNSFKLNMKYFDFDKSLKMYNKKNMEKLFNIKERTDLSKDISKHKVYSDIACSLQRATERIIIQLCQEAKKLSGSKNLCLSGGVSLNAVANSKIIEKGVFKNIHIPPGAGDAGTSIGAALYYYNKTQKKPSNKHNKKLFTPYTGPCFTEIEVKKCIQDHNITFKEYKSESDLIKASANTLCNNAVVGWFQGKMEFGDRALGNRSILGDPRNKKNWQRINLKIKFRESFRPFAPSVLDHQVKNYYKLARKIPYMNMVLTSKTNKLKATSHVDKSSRVQSVSIKNNRLFYLLINEFYKKTGCPALINTSFNIRSEPIVCNPDDAIKVFMHTDMDYLVMNKFIISKKDNLNIVDERKKNEFKNSFKLD